MNTKRKPIDLKELEKLCSIHATLSEIANWFSVSERTIDTRVSEDKTYQYDNEEFTFKQIMERGYARGRISLRRKQVQLADSGNPAMCIWLGKQVLGQKDVVEQQLSGAGGGPLQIEIIRVAVDRTRAEIEE